MQWRQIPLVGSRRAVLDALGHELENRHRRVRARMRELDAGRDGTVRLTGQRSRP